MELQGRGETVWERSVWASDSWGHGKTKDIGLGAMLGWMRQTLAILYDLAGLVPLPSLFCHRYNGRNEMNMSEAFSPGPGIVGLS